MIELLQAEILVRRLGTISDFDNDSWEKKIVKIFKALKVMEKHKDGEPLFSNALKELAGFLQEKRGHLGNSQLMKSCAKSDMSMQDFSAINPVDSIFNNKLMNDSILTVKDANN